MFLIFKKRYENIEKILIENFEDKMFEILFCGYKTENSFCLSLCLKEDYCNEELKTNRYIQFNVTNEKIELYDLHKKDYRKKFYDENKEKIEYLCKYIKENKYYENIKLISSNKNNRISIYSDFLRFNININNEMELICSYNSIETDNLNDSFKIYCDFTKLSKKTQKVNFNIEEVLENTLIKKEDVSPEIIKELALLNRVKVKKKTKNLPKD